MNALDVVALLLVVITFVAGIRAGLGRGVLAGADSVGGGIIGLGQGLLVVWLAGGLLAAGPLPNLAAQAQRSVAVRTLNGFLPPPTQIAGELGRWLDASGLPEVFVGLEPIPAPPVGLPSDPTARALAQLAIPSTVEVHSQACSYTLAGSGFVVQDEYVVTNAHVIAGARLVVVLPGSGSHQAIPVLFDPRLHIALLWVGGLGGPAPRPAAEHPGRGATGAALGHPGGGPLVVVPAAVADGYRATGRDLYGEATVTRAVVELRAAIERGDSGGPFVLEDGTVGGAGFAPSRPDPAGGA